MSDSSYSGDGVLLTPSLFWTSSMSDFSRPHDHTSPHHGKKVKGTGRHSYKQSTREKEAVWPDFLETALIEALTIYRPTSSKAPQKLLRFPKRNAFISSYIFKVTGKWRTPKQVGSRLQQLRETCSSEDILTLIQSKEFPDLPPKVSQLKQDALAPDLQKKCPCPLGSNSSMSTLSPDSSTLYSSSPCTSPTSSGFSDHDLGSSSNPTITQSGWPRHLVHVLKPYEVDLPPNWMHQPWPGVQPASFTLDLDESRLSDSPMNWQRRITVLAPRPVWAFVLTVVFSASMLSPNSEYETFFAVHDVNGNAFYKEVTKLERVSTVSGEMPMLYRTSLILNYWATLASKVLDLRQYTIVQDIMKVGIPVDHVNRPQCSVVYKFDYSPLSPIQILPNSLSSYYPSYPQDPPQLQPDYYLFSQQNLSSIPSVVFDSTDFSATPMLPMNDFSIWIDCSTANCYAHSIYTPTTNLNESDISASLPFRDFFPY